MMLMLAAVETMMTVWTMMKVSTAMVMMVMLVAVDTMMRMLTV